MEQPLGYAVGNALEVKEAIETLQGNGPEDLTTLCIELGSKMLVLGEVVQTQEEGVEKLKQLIHSGAAFEKFKTLIKIQGGDVNVVENTELLPTTRFSKTFNSTAEGYLWELNALKIGLASMKLGAGRATKNSAIDYGAGILLKKKMGDFVEKRRTNCEIIFQ